MYVSFDAYCGLFSIRSKKTVSAIEKLLSQVILYQNKLAILIWFIKISVAINVLV